MTPNTDISSIENKDGFFRRAIGKYIEKKFPRKIKRMIFISTITGLVKRIQEPSEEHIQKINEIFQVTRNPDAMLMSIKVKNVVWKNINTSSIHCEHAGTISLSEILTRELDSSDYKTIGHFFAEKAPSWLRYGSIELMCTDAIQLIKVLKKAEI